MPKQRRRSAVRWPFSWSAPLFSLHWEYDPSSLLIHSFKPLTILNGCTARFVSDLIRNPEDRFSHNATHIRLICFGYSQVMVPPVVSIRGRDMVEPQPQGSNLTEPHPDNNPMVHLLQVNITKTHPCNILLFFTAVKKKVIFRWKFMMVFLFLLKTLIVGTRWNRLNKAVLTSTHNLCFRAKIRKNVYPCKLQF